MAKKQERANTQEHQPRSGEGEIGDSIRILALGAKFLAKHKGTHYTAVVRIDEGGVPTIELNGQTCSSLSAAGRAITGYPVNGWRFCHVVEAEEAQETGER